ncbi:4-hydroxyphenylacetate 3-hydroxylase C-terminal domain-containing protein [Streptomyces sp. NPDC088354]|uniref:4-hydroxyphenylacetate 3-hydroxylase C-terminal domain-containing protein n=1 Tax=Streptomyces sp. NPDC088354 TaxID=3365856 RepID=UPI0037F82F18
MAPRGGDDRAGLPGRPGPRRGGTGRDPRLNGGDRHHRSPHGQSGRSVRGGPPLGSGPIHLASQAAEFGNPGVRTRLDRYLHGSKGRGARNRAKDMKLLRDAVGGA